MIKRRRPSEQPLELFDGEPCVTHDAAHRIGVHGIVAGYGEDSRAVGHDDVLSLACDAEASLLERSNGLLVMNPRNLGHGCSDRDVDFADLRVSDQLFDDGQVVGNRLADVLHRLILRGAL